MPPPQATAAPEQVAQQVQPELPALQKVQQQKQELQAAPRRAAAPKNKKQRRLRRW